MFGRKALGLAVAAAMVIGVSAAPAMADTMASGYQHVFVIVDSNITLGGGSSNPGGGYGGDSNGEGTYDFGTPVDLGNVQHEIFDGIIYWQIDANTEAVKFCLQASDLYKGDDPTDPVVPPIPLYIPAGVHFMAADGNPALGQSATQPWSPTTVGFVDGFPVRQTDYVTIESSQNGHFSQQLTTTLYWNQDDPEKPKGQYSGVVCLMAMTVDQLN